MIVLLYQNGIANVFRTYGAWGPPKRLEQHAYSVCESFASGVVKGIKLAGGSDDLMVKHWDKLGNAAQAENEWAEGPGDMFAGAKNPPLTA